MTGRQDAPGRGGAGTAGEDDETTDQPPELVRVIRGQVSDDELAALVAGIVATRAAEPDDPEPPRPSAWSDHGRRLGLSARPGRDSWRWSAHR